VHEEEGDSAIMWLAPLWRTERAATLKAENLRVKAAREPGAEGTEDTDDAIALGGDGAEAVFYALNAPAGGSDRPWALYQAVKGLHDERLRQKS
jgi:hypothetical protein